MYLDRSLTQLPHCNFPLSARVSAVYLFTDQIMMYLPLKIFTGQVFSYLFLESVIEQLKDRFSDKVKLAANFEILLPKQCHEKGIEDERFLKLFQAYSDTLISSNFSYTYLQCQSPYHKLVYR